MRRVLLLLAVLVPAAGAAPAVNKWIAVGDSIMAGSTWPILAEPGCPLCGVVFDCSGGCDLTPQTARDQCGVPRRLGVWLEGGGTNHVVKNLGKGREMTTEAVSRLQMTVMPGECGGSPGDCIAMILMHGTNDMFGNVSPETAAANLAIMIGEARSRNVDTLLMTVIRKINAPNNPKWLAYRNLTLALAASESIPSVDPYGPLCPTTPCYNANYWVAGACPDDVIGETSVGHPDPDGYDIMGNLVKAAFPASVPAAPDTASPAAAPAGDICSQTPRFVWPVSPAARWYALEVDATTTTWWEASAHCAGGTCTATPAGSLGAGAHTWRVRARNLRGLGAWSAGVDFVVGPPPAPVPVAPTGALFVSAPTYEWLEVACASEYDLEVRDSLGNLETEATHLLASAVCSAGRCSYQGGTLADPDDYTLKVLARNAVGAGPLSSTGAEFTILACDDPSQEDLEVLAPGPVTTTQIVSHCGPVTAAAMGTYAVEASGDLSVHTRDGFTAFDGLVVEGKLTVKSP
jgi:lysophospholipase L1-like esterase